MGDLLANHESDAILLGGNVRLPARSGQLSCVASGRRNLRTYCNLPMNISRTKAGRSCVGWATSFQYDAEASRWGLDELA
jgi:hypothetical protein